jgi:hypothetical protein
MVTVAVEVEVIPERTCVLSSSDADVQVVVVVVDSFRTVVACEVMLEDWHWDVVVVVDEVVEVVEDEDEDVNAEEDNPMEIDVHEDSVEVDDVEDDD